MNTSRAGKAALMKRNLPYPDPLHNEEDGCDPQDPHEWYHHETDDNPNVSHYCNHPECRADDD